METSWLLGTLAVIVAISNAQELTVLDEYYLVGLRDLYKFGNLTVGERPPYAVLALDFAGYRDLPYGFQRPNSPVTFLRAKAELWPCKGNFSWPVDEDTTVIGAQDFNKDGLLTYSNLLRKYADLIQLRPPGPHKHLEVHIFFSHLPSPAIFHAFSLIAKRMRNITYTIGYYKNAPAISGTDLTESLHSTALEIVKEHPNINFGRIEGKNSSVAGLMKSYLNACYLNTPKVKMPGYPEPEVFLAKRKIVYTANPGGPGRLRLKSEFRIKRFRGGAGYYCKKDANSQVATVEQLKRSANNGYKFPCSWQADGRAREVVDTCNGKLEVRLCNPEWPYEAYVMCSGKKANVKYIERSKSGTSKNILGEGNDECMKTLGTYLIGIKQLEEAASIGYYNDKCAYTTDGKRYKIARVGNNDTSLTAVECTGEETGFYCSLEKPEVFRWPVDTGGYQSLFRTADNANEECRNQGFHLSTLKQLRHSWSKGLDYCDCGFLNNGAVMYPINHPRDGCEESLSPGLRQCPRNPRQWNRSGWAAYCSNAPLPIVEQETGTSDWETAMDTCKEQGRGMARFEHYMEAANLGFRDQRCLMTANGQSYTFGEVIKSCSSPTNFYCTRFQSPVFHIDTDYSYPNIEAAERGCHEKGSTLASEELLELAYQLGYDQCSCGFLRGGKVRYPINRPRNGCGDVEGAGLRDCPTSPRAWSRSGWDAYCVSLQI